MSDVADDYLDLAEELSDSDSEAARRTAVSRAYYGAFHAVHPAVEAACDREPEYGAFGKLAHREVAYRLRRWAEVMSTPVAMQYGAEARRVHQQFMACMDLRHRADYADGADGVPTKQEAITSCAKARRVAAFSSKVCASKYVRQG